MAAVRSPPDIVRGIQQYSLEQIALRMAAAGLRHARHGGAKTLRGKRVLAARVRIQALAGG